MTRNRVVLTVSTLSHIFAWAATLFFIFWPVYSGVSVRAGESGVGSVSGKTLIEVNGLWAALLIVLPIIFTAIALIASFPSVAHPRLMLTLRWTAFALLLTFCAVSSLSIGLFYLPAAIAALVAAIVRGRN
ncbi:MAG: hypothetical protein F4Y44_11420 [Chloroflexi bacterium]|nr:hypothetical protein [Chloroflexota bacterium]